MKNKKTELLSLRHRVSMYAQIINENAEKLAQTERALELVVKTFWKSYKLAYDCPATTCTHMAGVCGTDKYCIPAIKKHFLALAEKSIKKGGNP